MISWPQIIYGAVLSAIAAGLVCGLATRGKQPAAILTAAVAAAVLLGAGALRAAPARRATILAVLAGLSALVVDVYLY